MQSPADILASSADGGRGRGRFTDASVLVTGAGGGIGAATSLAFLREGARVLATDRDEEALTRLTRRARALGQDLVTRAGDLSQAAFCQQLMHETRCHAGRLDVLVNNAGVMRRGTILQTSDADWALSMEVNVSAVFRLCRAAIPIMRDAGGGAIVNVASAWGIHPGPGHLAYCTSKAAVAAMTGCLGRDHAADGVRVNAVCPNEVNTPMLRTGFEARGLDPDTAVQSLNATVPLGRIAEPGDIADVILFLASDEARYVAGTLVEVTGAKPVG